MENIAEQGNRTLEAMADYKDLLRLAHEALHRIKQDVHGKSYDSAEIMSLKLHDLRYEVDLLSKEIDGYVKEIETNEYH